jgi:hypothetical protein
LSAHNRPLQFTLRLRATAKAEILPIARQSGNNTYYTAVSVSGGHRDVMECVRGN